MATTPRNTPIYQDELIAWHNQRLWWLLCGSGVVIVALTVALCVLTLRPHNTPYVIEVDNKGQPMGTVQPFMDQQPVADSTVQYELSEFIRDAFSITGTFSLNQMMLQRVYAMSTGQASEALTSYYRADHDAHNPLVIYAKYWQTARVIRTLRLPAKDTYEVDYIIDRHDHDHVANAAETNWRAIMRAVAGKPTANNRLGVWITDIDFSPEAK